MEKTKPKNKNLSKAMKGNTNSVGNKGGTGRPTKWSEEVPVLMWNYLENTKDEMIKTQFGVKVVPNIPMIIGVALEMGINEDTLDKWYNKFKAKSSKDQTVDELSFVGAFDSIKAEQAKRLVNNGLGKSYDSNFAKFLLSSNHGMTDRLDLTSKGKGISMFGKSHAELKALEEAERASKT